MAKLKSTALLFGLGISVLLSGCNLNSDSPENRDTAQETTALITEAETVTPPESGWTAEELNRVIAINGVNYDYPVTLGELSEKYTYDEEFMFVDNIGTFFYYNDIYAFGGGLEYNDSESISNDSKLVTATFTVLDDGSQIKSSDLVSVNGVRLGDTYETMISQLGTPDTVNEDSSYKYNVNGKTALAIYFLGSDKIQAIQISWE
ncbi:hypothetical protein [Huintestinicola sp.]